MRAGGDGAKGPQGRESASLDTHGASEAEGSSLSSTGLGLSCASRAITAARAVASRAAVAFRRFSSFFAALPSLPARRSSACSDQGAPGCAKRC